MLGEMKKGFKYRLAANWDYFGLPGILILVVVIFSSLSPAFRSSYSLMANFKFSALTAIAAIGMTFCITSGDFDISIGSMLALVSVLGATFAQHLNGVFAVLLTLALASFLGFVNGLFVTKLNIPAFITTLGMMFIYRALAYIYTNNTPVSIRSPFWLFIGNGSVLKIPFSILLMALCFLFGILLLRKTPFGRFVIAVGSNKNAAVLSGIRFDGIKILVFVMVGFFVGVSAVIMSANFGSANPGLMGQGYEFQVITAVVLGGTALSGGTPNLIGAFFAAMILSYLKNGLGLMQVNSYWQFIATGLVLILAVAINRFKFGLLGQKE